MANDCSVIKEKCVWGGYICAYLTVTEVNKENIPCLKVILYFEDLGIKNFAKKAFTLILGCHSSF